MTAEEAEFESALLDALDRLRNGKHQTVALVSVSDDRNGVTTSFRGGSRAEIVGVLHWGATIVIHSTTPNIK